MKSKLKILDKVMIPSVLPEKGNIITMTIIKDIISKVALTQNDIEEYSITTLPNGSLKWIEPKEDAFFEIEFTDLEVTEIKKGINALDAKQEIVSDMMGLVNIFIK